MLGVKEPPLLSPKLTPVSEISTVIPSAMPSFTWQPIIKLHCFKRQCLASFLSLGPELIASSPTALKSTLCPPSLHTAFLNRHNFCFFTSIFSAPAHSVCHYFCSVERFFGHNAISKDYEMAMYIMYILSCSFAVFHCFFFVLFWFFF